VSPTAALCKGSAIVSTVELFNSFACNAMRAAKEADEPRERFVLLKLALEWTAAAKRDSSSAIIGDAIYLSMVARRSLW
jgi:hypothetical protein